MIQITQIDQQVNLTVDETTEIINIEVAETIHPAFIVTEIEPDPSTFNQNNIPLLIAVELLADAEIATFVTYINTLSLPLIISEFNSLIQFKVASLNVLFQLVGIGKGTYGSNQTQIGPENVLKSEQVDISDKLDKGGYGGTAQDIVDLIPEVDISDKLDKGGYGGTAQDIVDLIPEFQPGQNITILDSVVDVDIPPFVNVSNILGTTGSAPAGIAIDSLGNIYTANNNSNNVTKITPAGVSTILGITGSSPESIAIDSLGNIYTANLSANNVTKITPAGVSTIFGTTLNNPAGIAIDSLGNIYTADSSSNRVTKITPAGVRTTLGTTGSTPYKIVVDSVGNVYTCNYNSNNVTKITPAGVSTILGTTGSRPVAIAIDSLGNIYTANSNSNNVTKITPLGVSTILGTTGVYPLAIAIDSVGNIYTSSYSLKNVTKITPAGVSTVFGMTENNPAGIAIDSISNVYTANRDDNNVTKITLDNNQNLAVNNNGKIIRVPLPYTKSESDAKDTAVITTLRDGVVPEGNTLQKLFNLVSGAGAEITVANITARNALNISSIGTRVFVTDDGDGNWALYRASQTGVSSNFIKLSDPDLLNAVMSAAAIKTAYESNPDTNAFTNALKTAYDAVIAALPNKADISNISQTVEVDKTSTIKWYSAKSIYDWVTDKLALKLDKSPTDGLVYAQKNGAIYQVRDDLTIADATNSAEITASTNTLVKEYDLGSFNGRNIMTFTFFFEKVVFASELVRAEIFIFDTVTLTETLIASNAATGVTKVWPCERHLTLNQVTGNMKGLQPTVNTATDVTNSSSSMVETAFSFSNPLKLRIYLRTAGSGSSVRAYSSLIILR